MTQGTRETLFWFGGIGCGIICASVDPLVTIFGFALAICCVIALHGKKIKNDLEG